MGANLKVALLQMTAEKGDWDANLVKGDEYCKRAGQMGADIALFPEMWSTAYTPGGVESEERMQAWHALAVTQASDYVKHFRSLARNLDMAIAITYLEGWQGAPRNTVSLIDRHGEFVLQYAKIHTCDFDYWERAITPGDGFYICALDTAAGAVCVGAMICYDREFPESARILMLQGAEVILTPNACTLERHRIQQISTRAFENMCGIAVANYAAPQNNGHSVAFDAVASDIEGNTLDNCLVEAGEEEGVYMASFDLDKMRVYRRREIWGNAFRKPKYYSPLFVSEVKQPFIRPEARR